MKTVLCVGPNRADLERLSASVEEAGHQTMLASNAREALEVLAGRRVDAVIAVQALADVDGVGLRQRIGRIDRNIPVLLYDGSVEAAATAVRCLEKFIDSSEDPREVLAHMAE